MQLVYTGGTAGGRVLRPYFGPVPGAPASETRNPGPWTLNPEPETRNLAAMQRVDTGGPAGGRTPPPYLGR